jgi:hypothetical protein
MKKNILSSCILTMSLLLFISCDQALICEKSGGTVELGSCCESVGNFPNLCLEGPCTCSPENSHEVLVCQCPEGFCWNGADGGGCIAINSAIVEEDGIEYYLGTDKHTYELGSTVKATYRLTNKSNFVKLMGNWPNLGALQPIDIIQGEKVIWDVPVVPYELTKFFLGPNKSCEYTMGWEMETWPEHEPVEPGIYTVIAALKPEAVSISVDIEIISGALAN